MSIALVPLVLALFGGVPTATTEAVPGIVASEAVVAQDAPAGAGQALMEQVWRRYRRLGSAAITETGQRVWADGRIEPIRVRTVIAPTAEMRILATDHKLTFKGGVAYAESPYYPGMQIKIPVPPVPDAAVDALARAWPVDVVPLEVRLRLSSTPEKAFGPWLALVGADASVTTGAGVWPDGRSTQLLRMRSADGETDIAIWIDDETGFMRGLRGRVAGRDGRPASMIEVLYETMETQSRPPINVVNRGVEVVDSYAALLKTWTERYAVPPAPPVDGAD